MPDQSASERIVAFAHDLWAGVGSVQYSLGPGALPHVSLAHTAMRPTDPDPSVVWKEVSEVIDRQVSITIAGLELHPYRTAYNASSATTGGLRVYLHVPLNSGLLRMRDQLFATQYFNEGEVTHCQRELPYDPHFTVGATTPSGGTRTAAPFDVPADLIGLAMPVRLAVGPIGPHGVLEEVSYGGW